MSPQLLLIIQFAAFPPSPRSVCQVNQHKITHNSACLVSGFTTLLFAFTKTSQRWRATATANNCATSDRILFCVLCKCLSHSQHSKHKEELLTSNSKTRELCNWMRVHMKKLLCGKLWWFWSEFKWKFFFWALDWIFTASFSSENLNSVEVKALKRVKL